MAAKKHKPKKSSITKEAAAAPRRQQWPWSELPLTTSSLHPHNFRLYSYRLLQNLNFAATAAVAKSSPPPTTRCDARPRPRLRHVPTAAANETRSNINPHSHFLRDGASIAHAIHDLPAAAAAALWCYLRWDTKPELLPPPSGKLYTDTLLGIHLWLRGVSLGPNAPTSALIADYSITSDVSQSLNWHRRASIRHDCTTPDPFDAEKKPMEFTSLLHFQGKYYATSLQGAIVVMQVVHTRLRITGVGPTRGVPSSNSRFFKEYLFETKGEILLVFLVHENSLEVVDDVEVFRLDLDKLCWIKVERLKGMTLFLKERCICLDSVGLGWRDDRVYFTEGLDKRWRVYDMKSCCILPVF